VLSTAALAARAPAPLLAQSTVGQARTVLAAVVDSQGRPLVDVGLDDFVVAEGTMAREVLDVHVADYPLAMVIDDRPEAAEALPILRRAAFRFVERVGERPIALFRLSSATPMAGLDSDRATVGARLDDIAVTDGATAGSALETIARAASLLQASGAPFSAIIVAAAAPIDAAAPVRGELLPAIQSSGAMVHVVQGQAAGAAPEPDQPDLLRVLADQTRGQFTAIFASVSFAAALDRLADRLAIEMMVQYLVPAGPKPGDVRVGVRIPGARVVGMGVK
jgi:hypothetical protein